MLEARDQEAQNNEQHEQERGDSTAVHPDVRVHFSIRLVLFLVVKQLEACLILHELEDSEQPHAYVFLLGRLVPLDFFHYDLLFLS